MKPSSRRRKLKACLGFWLSCSVLSTTLAPPFLQASAWNERRAALEKNQWRNEIPSPALPPSPFKTSPSLGNFRRTENLSSRTGVTFFLLQDVHQAFTAQLNIARFLRS